MPPTKQAACRRRCSAVKRRREHLAAIRANKKQLTDQEPAREPGMSNLLQEPAAGLDVTGLLPEGIQEPAVPDPHPEPEQIPASVSKLQRFAPAANASIAEAGSTVSAELPTTVVDLNTLKPLFSGMRCTNCRGGYFELLCDQSRTAGFVVYLYLQCNKCDFVKPGVFTSQRLSDSSAFLINRSAVASALVKGTGYSGIASQCEVMNMPLMSDRTFQDHSEAIHSKTKDYKEEILAESVKAVKQAYQQDDSSLGTGIEPLDITVSFDGSWHTRGHSSNNGVGCVIDTKTGLVVDYHVMSKFCKLCSTTGEKLKVECRQKYEEWFDKHKEQCTKNFEGTAGAMEIEAALVCWGRSEEKKLRYTSVVSDGDCKTIKKINELKPYGEIIVKKEECVNHVAKRLGKALRDLVETKKKMKVTLGGRGDGKLTQNKINKLQKYYTKAVRSSNTLEEMKQSIWATFHHSTSSDASPKHEFCPDGFDSWCFFKRSLARGEEPPSHKTKLGSYLCPEVASCVKDVYERLSDAELLERCLAGKTQNANESLHNLLWSRCPKTIFVQRKRLETSLGVGIGEFNQGSVATQLFLRKIGLNVGVASVGCGLKRDKRRIYFSQYAVDENNRKRKEQKEAAKQKERQELLEREEVREGERLYLAGGGD